MINETISNRLKEIFEYIAPNYRISLQEWNHDIGHIHCLFKAHPNSVRTIKEYIRNQGEIKDHEKKL